MERPLHVDTSALSRHAVLDLLRTPEAVRVFLRFQVFAVWDYMTLLKAMQQRFTGSTLPWKPAPWSGEVVRLVNQLVLDEESDLDRDGRIRSHYQSFLEIMAEAGVSTSEIRQLVASGDPEPLPGPVRRFVAFTLGTATTGMDEELAAALLIGREAGVPEAYAAISRAVGNQRVGFTRLARYCDRHVDRDDAATHRLLAIAERELIGFDSRRREWAEASARRALEVRRDLWNAAARAIVQERADLPAAANDGPANR